MAEDENFTQNDASQTTFVLMENGEENASVSDYQTETSDDDVLSENATEYIINLRNKQFPHGYVIDQWDLLRIIFPEEYQAFELSNGHRQTPSIYAPPVANVSTTLTWSSSSSPHVSSRETVSTTWSVRTPISSVAVSESVNPQLGWQWIAPLAWLQPAITPITAIPQFEINEELTVIPEQHYTWVPTDSLDWNAEEEMSKTDTTQSELP